MRVDLRELAAREEAVKAQVEAAEAAEREAAQAKEEAEDAKEEARIEVEKITSACLAADQATGLARTPKALAPTLPLTHTVSDCWLGDGHGGGGRGGARADRGGEARGWARRAAARQRC